MDETEAFAEADAADVRQLTWTLMRGVPGLHGAAFDAWNSLWQGALAAHKRRLELESRSLALLPPLSYCCLRPRSKFDGLRLYKIN